MSSKIVSAQISEDSELYEELQEFSADYESQSEAVRSLLRAGLDTKRPPADTAEAEAEAPLTNDVYALWGTIFGVFGGVAALLSFVVAGVFLALGVLTSGVTALVAVGSLALAMFLLGAALALWRMAKHSDLGASEQMFELVGGGRQ